MTEPALGTSSSVPKEGLVDYAWQRAFGDRVSFVTLEFGTYPFRSMLEALRAVGPMRLVIFAALLTLSVIFLPGGLMEGATRIWNWVSGGGRPRGGDLAAHRL